MKTHSLTVATFENALQEAFQLWMESMQARAFSPKTLYGYKVNVGAFIRFLNAPGLTELEQVQPTHIRKWLTYRREKGVSNAQLWNDYRQPRTFWNWCLREELTTHNPFTKVEKPRLETVVKPALTPEQVEALLKACEGKDWLRLRDRALLLTLLDTGLRASEVHSLKATDEKRDTLLIRGKGGKRRVVFLCPETRLALRRYLNACPHSLTDDSPLWWGRNGALTLWGLLEVIENIGKRAGITPLGAHIFRRTHAVWSLRSGIDLAHLQKMLGHSSMSVLVKHYLPLLESDLKEAHRQHSPVNTLLNSRRTRK